MDILVATLSSGGVAMGFLRWEEPYRRLPVFEKQTESAENKHIVWCVLSLSLFF